MLGNEGTPIFHEAIVSSRKSVFVLFGDIKVPQKCRSPVPSLSTPKEGFAHFFRECGSAMFSSPYGEAHFSLPHWAMLKPVKSGPLCS